MSAMLSTRTSSRGAGISKRERPVRVDRDGDLDMDRPSGRGRNGRQLNRGRGRRHLNLNEPSRGSTADHSGRNASGNGAGKSRGGGRGHNANRSHGGSNRKPTGPLGEVKVEGWAVGKGSFEDCIDFLEKKAKMRFSKTIRTGDSMIIRIPINKLQSLLDWDNVFYESVNLKITSTGLMDMATENIVQPKEGAMNTKQVLKQVLASRYNVSDKILDLSNLGNEPLLREIGFFELHSTASKMFPALMLVADQTFTTAQAKREAISSVSLAYNNIITTRTVAALAPTFPDLKALSLENNLIENWKSLENWSNKFRKLEHLVLIGNPITKLSGYKNEVTRRWPNLITLDNEVIDRPRAEVDSTSKQIPNNNAASRGVSANQLPLPTKGNFTVDNDGIVTQFLTTFFGCYAGDREALLAGFYDSTSKFSLSVNTSSPRVSSEQNQRQYWDVYIPVSRNLKRIGTGSGREEKLAVGTDSIRSIWNQLPPVAYDLSKPELWSFDVYPTELAVGVGGMLAMVHGEFDESNEMAGKVLKRSFDRTFTLCRAADGSVKVANDMFVIRSYGGSHSWRPEAIEPVNSDVTSAPEDDQIKQQKCQLFSEKSGLTLQYSEWCLVETGWDLESAWVSFQTAKSEGKLGPEAFINQSVPAL